MALLPESATWEAGIYQIETTDAVIGGVAGISNIQGKQLANRTKYLYDNLNLLDSEVGDLFDTVDDHTTQLSELTDTKLVALGTNYSKGIVSKTGGAITAIASDIGKLSLIELTANIVVVTLPDYAAFEIGSKLNYVIIDADNTHPAGVVFFEAHAGQNILGNPNYFIPGDIVEFTFRGTIPGWVISDVSRGLQMPTGAVIGYAVSTPPAGWLECDGAAISRTTYSGLFTKIGVVHGVGDGVTTFNVPDLRGKFIRGWDNGAGVDTGRVFGSFQDDAFESHTHSTGLQNELVNHGGAVPVNQQTGGGGDLVTATGGTETRPKNVALLHCIKF